MTNIRFSPEARNDLAEIGDYLSYQLRNKSAARNLMARIQSSVLSPEQFPESGTPILFAGPSIVYRYLVCGSYMIFYHISMEAVHIDRILYGRRDYLSILFGEQLCDDEEK